MRRDLELRLFAAESVAGSRLSKAAKLQLMNFIEHDASDAQIKALIMDGKVTQLDELAEQVVHDRWTALIS